MSAAVHEINAGDASSTVAGITSTAGLGISPTGRASSAYGFASRAVKVNLPFLAQGDALYLQGAYGQGAMSYTGISNYTAPYDALAAAPREADRSCNTIPMRC